jgi:hypothetical protein
MSDIHPSEIDVSVTMDGFGAATVGFERVNEEGMFEYCVRVVGGKVAGYVYVTFRSIRGK